MWRFNPASAKRVGHPAPFPVELPAQLIRLYTYADDLVLDPFMGSGSTLVAAAALGRRYAGSFPEAYRTIKAINLGLEVADADLAEELEGGRNQCALG